MISTSRLLDPSREPAHPRARVVWLEPVEKPSTTPAAALTTSDLVAAGDNYDERPPVWDEPERIVGYRITDANQHQAFVEASRSPLDRLYDEHAAAKRQLEPAVIIRRNIGQVLGVR